MTWQLYRLYRRSRGKDGEKFYAVAEGFSFGAAIFAFFWALYHRLWLEATGLIFLSSYTRYLFELNWKSGELSTPFLLGAMLGNMSVFLLMGLFGRDFLCMRYERLGYERAGVLLATSSRDAIGQWQSQKKV